jgi:hypothetical protein
MYHVPAFHFRAHRVAPLLPSRPRSSPSGSQQPEQSYPAVDAAAYWKVLPFH